uniref:PLD phosphodiesterase domain-containing protein n=1 Tax=Corethron hystrix TaxID=216773 RepID=A0A7S1FXU7_9STRA|mmetsp:Transcript_39075/g.90989  ORF Transcript_39075/g.90989 Transcript_39075/m.90989 type:complete len:576 (+) Transcript_39075:198-1925(+)
MRSLGLSLICDPSSICGFNKSYVNDEVEDDSASNLSHVGSAAYDALKIKHGWYHHSLWNVTSGRVVGELDHTPKDAWTREEGDPVEGHDDWFPEKLGEIISRTEIWCDVLSLGPPDGAFMDEFNKALITVAERAKSQEKIITVRMMFGNIPAMPVNCKKVIKKLTWGIPNDDSTFLRLWVGAWRKNVSWNHAKIIAVDGHMLHTGGHNLWDRHYLKDSPVHDLSFELEGRITNDAHRFANEQWSFIRRKQHTLVGYFVDKIPDNWLVAMQTRVTVSEFPKGIASEFAPSFNLELIPFRERLEDSIPMISVGRYGSLTWKLRPADDAMLAMLNSSTTIIRMALQDLGPCIVPDVLGTGTKIPLPGLEWPKPYMDALGRAIWERGVDVEIVLSHPNSIPDGLGPTEANYGNGWTCEDVASYIINRIRKKFPDSESDGLRKKVEGNLRVCYLKQKIGREYSNGIKMGMHAKHFIVDDICTYIGSQNLYVCDLAEWGVIVDNADQTRKFMDEYWNPIWASSFTGEDCNVEEVMNGLDIDRDGDTGGAFEKLDPSRRMSSMLNSGNKPTDTELFGEDTDE